MLMEIGLPVIVFASLAAGAFWADRSMERWIGPESIRIPGWLVFVIAVSAAMGVGWIAPELSVWWGMSLAGALAVAAYMVVKGGCIAVKYWRRS